MDKILIKSSTKYRKYSENEMENVIYKMAAIIFRPSYIK